VDQSIKMSKKKILLLSDDLRLASGIGTMSKEFVLGTVDKFTWFQVGAGVKHPDMGKIIDVSDDVREKTGIKDADVKILPFDGYGNIGTIRKILSAEKFDAILHFTDPHYWVWLYENEHELRQQIPILYYHIWDNLPDPMYNTNNSTWKPLEDWQISYVPHGINQNVFKPVDKISDEIKSMVYGDKKYDFILFYNNRNIRRKQPSDVIYSYKLFCDKLPKDKAKKCLLLMHTTPVDVNGTDLYAVKDALCPDYDVKLMGDKLDQDKLNELYNLVDCTINIANNEGFGLTTAESVMAGTPIIVNVTGGLQDQCGFDSTDEDYVSIGTLHDKEKYSSTPHGSWVVPVWPSSININGSVATPYIFDDRVNDEEVSNAIMQVYTWSKKDRKKRGLEGREWAIKNISSKIMCDKMAEGIETAIKNFKPRKKYDLYKII